MADYKPVLFDLMETPAEIISRADDLAIVLNGNKLLFGEMLSGVCNPFITHQLSPSTMTNFKRIEVLEKEAESFGPLGDNITLIYNNRIIKDAEFVDLEGYLPEIRTLGPSLIVYGKEGNSGTASGTAKLIIYGEMPKEIEKINAGIKTEDMGAVELGRGLFKKIYGESPETTYIGDDSYFLSGTFHSVQTNDNYHPDIDREFIRAHILGEDVDFIVDLSDCEDDLSLDVIVLSTSLERNITQELIDKTIAELG